MPRFPSCILIALTLGLLSQACSNEVDTRPTPSGKKKSGTYSEDGSGKGKGKTPSKGKGSGDSDPGDDTSSNDEDDQNEEEEEEKPSTPPDTSPPVVMNPTPTPDVKPPVDPMKPNVPDVKPPTTVDLPPSQHLDGAFMSSFLDEIAGPEAAGRGTGTPQNAKVAQKIADEFKALGFKPGGDNGTYLQAFSAKGLATNNVIGILPGETDEYIVIGAHMDHLGTTGGQIYPGADDNASGTTGMVGSARAFAKNTAKMKRGIIFMAYSGEEMGLLGSIHFVKNPTVPLSKIKFMVNMDMIGRYRTTLDVIGVEKTIEGNSITRELIGKTQLKPNFLKEVGAGGSDHMPFKDRGIPVAAFHTQLHAEYHKPTDKVATIDKNNLKVIAGIASDLAYRLANVPTFTPASFSLAPIETDGVTNGIHAPAGCTPGLVSLEEVQANLSSLND